MKNIKTRDQLFEGAREITDYKKWEAACRKVKSDYDTDVISFVELSTGGQDYVYAVVRGDSDSPVKKAGIWFQDVPQGAYGEVYSVIMPLTNKESKDLAKL